MHACMCENLKARLYQTVTITIRIMQSVYTILVVRTTFVLRTTFELEKMDRSPFESSSNLVEILFELLSKPSRTLKTDLKKMIVCMGKHGCCWCKHGCCTCKHGCFENLNFDQNQKARNSNDKVRMGSIIH